MDETHSGQIQKFLPNIRSDNGKIFNLGETTVPGMDKMEGHFAQILPPKVTDDQMRQLAKTMLKVKGVKPPSRRKCPSSALAPLILLADFIFGLDSQCPTGSVMLLVKKLKTDFRFRVSASHDTFGVRIFTDF